MTLVTVEGQGERRILEISISQKRGQAGGTATVHSAVGWGPGLSFAGMSRDALGISTAGPFEFHRES